MAHTPQALVFPHAQRAGSAPYAGLDDATLEHAAAQIRPTWSGSGTPRATTRSTRGAGRDEIASEAWPVPRALELAAAGRLPVHTVRPPDEAPEARQLPDTRRRLDFGGDSQAMPMADHTAPKLSLACDFTDEFPILKKRRSSLRWVALLLLTLAGGVWAVREGRIALPWLRADPSALELFPSLTTPSAPAPTEAEKAVKPVEPTELDTLPRGVEPPPAETVNEAPTREGASSASAPAATHAEAPRRGAKPKRARPRRLGKQSASLRPPTFEDFFPEERPAQRGPLGRASVVDNPY